MKNTLGKNITTTAATVLGVSFLATSTMTGAAESYSLYEYYRECGNLGFNSNNSTLNTDKDFKLRNDIAHKTKLDILAYEMFGQMREATMEERKSVKAYVDSISISSGENFFDLC